MLTKKSFAMKSIKVFLIACFALIFGLSEAQEIITSNGDYFSTVNGSLSFTIGEPITETFLGANNKLTQGFQQSRLKILSIFENIESSLIITVEPNPTNDKIKIKVDGNTNEHFTWKLFNSNGKIISQDLFEAPETEISLNGLSASVYYIIILADKKDIKGVKIIKQ